MAVVSSSFQHFITILGKMSNVQVCDFADGLVDEVKKFRFNKAKCSRAIIMKIDVPKQKVSKTYLYFK